jgi:DNA repair exonuclease SbcCD ATPase subunit
MADKLQDIDALREKRARFRERLAEAKATEAEESQVVADTVADGLPTPAGWGARRAELGAEVEALEAGLAKVEGELFKSAQATRLALAKIEQHAPPLRRKVQELRARRVTLHRDALRLADKNEPSPGFSEKLDSLEVELADVSTKLAALEDEMAPLKGVVSRYERDEERQHRGLAVEQGGLVA